MLSWIREKFGTVVIGGIITFIAFVFVFYGVFSPKSTRGLHEGAVAGTVNGDPISITEFNRELNRRMEFFKNLGGGKLSDEQLKSFHIREAVFQELANRKMMIQEANRQGMVAADEQVREKIREISAFQKDKNFDLATYKQVLEANNHTPSSFERLVQEDLSLQQWENYFMSRIHISESELKQEFAINQNKRKIKYVLLTPETVKKQVPVDKAEIQKFLTDPSKMNLVKMKFEEKKETTFKGQKIEAVQETIAQEMIAGEKWDQIQKINAELSEKIVTLLTTNKASDAQINLLLKPYQTEVKTTEFLSRRSSYIPQVGESRELMNDAFSARSPIDPTLGGKAKKYEMTGRVVVALVVESQKPDFKQFEKERPTLIRQISTRKSKDLYQEWTKSLVAKSKVETNPAVVAAE